MKRLILPVLILLVCSCAKDNSAPATVSAFIADNYTEDAKQLLFRRIQAGEHVAGYNDPIFNTDEVNKILQDIQAVYNRHDAAADSIFHIHTFPYINLRYISLKVDQNQTEGARLMNLQTSGNAGFDALLSQYGYTPVNKLLIGSNAYVEIKSAESRNVMALIPLLKSYLFILLAEPEGTVGDGSDIRYSSSGQPGSITSLDFSIGSGDCPAGCTSRHGWRFQVRNHSKAAFVGKY